MAESYARQDLIAFNRSLYDQWWAILDAQVVTDPQPNTDALAPSNCSDSEYERRKNELVRLYVAQGTTDDTVIVTLEECPA